VEIVLVILHSLIALLVILAVLLHSGKDAGLSGLGGIGTGSGAYGGSSAVVEKNLTRVTVVLGVMFFLTTFFLDRTL
jgi:preprotein translocase subunit SecG